MFRLATRPEKYLGTAEQWDHAEQALEEALKLNGLSYTVKPGDGAFYAPKIDIHIEDVLGRDWQMATIQADLTMVPERFGLEYIDADGQPKRPIVIHRAIFGSFERFVGILTEHFAGAFPAWLAPVQARVLPISIKHQAYAETVFARLRQGGLRVELDDRSEKLGLPDPRRPGPQGAVHASGRASARHATGRSACASGAARIWERSRWSASSPRSRSKSAPEP